MPPSDCHNLEYLLLRILGRDFIQYRCTLDFPLLMSLWEQLAQRGYSSWKIWKFIKAFQCPLGGWFSHEHPEEASPCLCRSACEPQDRGLGRVALRWGLVHSVWEQQVAEARKLILQIYWELFLQLIHYCVLPNILIFPRLGLTAILYVCVSKNHTLSFYSKIVCILGTLYYWLWPKAGSLFLTYDQTAIIIALCAWYISSDINLSVC